MDFPLSIIYGLPWQANTWKLFAACAKECINSYKKTTNKQTSKTKQTTKKTKTKNQKQQNQTKPK